MVFDPQVAGQHLHSHIHFVSATLQFFSRVLSRVNPRCLLPSIYLDPRSFSSNTPPFSRARFLTDTQHPTTPIPGHLSCHFLFSVIMDFGVGKSIFKSESGTVKQEKVKQENGFRIKSEFEPSLSSLPLAAPAPGKKEFKEDSKSVRNPRSTSPGFLVEKLTPAPREY